MRPSTWWLVEQYSHRCSTVNSTTAVSLCWRTSVLHIGWKPLFFSRSWRHGANFEYSPTVWWFALANHFTGWVGCPKDAVNIYDSAGGFVMATSVEKSIGPKKILVFPLTQPTLFFYTDPAIFIAFQKKVKRFSYLPTVKCFRKLDKKLKKCQNCKINAYSRIIFFTSLDVLNFIIYMFSGTVDDI